VKPICLLRCTEVFSTELGIRISFVKILEFRGKGFEPPKQHPPPSVRRWAIGQVKVWTVFLYPENGDIRFLKNIFFSIILHSVTSQWVLVHNIQFTLKLCDVLPSLITSGTDVVNVQDGINLYFASVRIVSCLLRYNGTF
jgi:hypothetical protein